MSKIRMWLALLRGEAVVLIKRDMYEADVVVGKGVNKQFAINSMVGAVKAMML